MSLSDLDILLDACVRLPAPALLPGERSWHNGVASYEESEMPTVRPAMLKLEVEQ